MTHESRQQIIQEIMDNLGESVECDQLVNKLADKQIISTDDVMRITGTEDKDKMKELVQVVMEKGDELHPLALKIVEALKHPNQQTTRRTDQAMDAVTNRSGTVAAPPSSDRRILSNSEVSNNWALKNFLFDISKQMGNEDLESMKDIMFGEPGFHHSAIEKIDTPMKLFRQLMNTGRMNAYNLHFLQALVRRIDRFDLNYKVRQFCLESHHQPIHFFAPSEQPENGYKYVKHHIEGGIDQLTHSQLEHLRAEVANLLCIPPMFVFVKGIEPADSLLFTFMVRETDVSSFIAIYSSQEISLVHLSVCVEIQDAELSLSEISPTPEKDHKPMFDQLKHLLEREQCLQRQLEERDGRLVDLQEELDSKEGENTVEQVLRGDKCDMDTHQLHQKYELYKNLFYRMVDVQKTMMPKDHKTSANGIVGSLKVSSASSLFRHLLSQAKQRCDTDLINKLLDTKTVIEDSLHEERLRRMQDIIVILSEQVEEQAEINANLRASTNIAGASSTFLHDILAVQEQTRNHAIKQQQEETHVLEISSMIGLQVAHRMYPAPQQISIPPEFQSFLANITTKDLTSKERSRLKTFLCFSDPEKEQLIQNPEKLLELAFLRELRKGRLGEPTETILGDILAKIRKRYLVDRYYKTPDQQPALIKLRSAERRSVPARSNTPQRIKKESESSTM
ncbi:uncharacterized protein LOC124138275 [Haliotis rufescens]|uniref:uncharacterized protein LOC124138275 n=1 Tax=Haliotis rufescens TaxID=6454 RepID=UPI00201EE710|nr:uncharacterized protein LOC124138275 [Haliotis rufescens]